MIKQSVHYFDDANARKEALRIHGYVSENDTSSDESVTSENYFERKYGHLKPTLNFERHKRATVVVSDEEISEGENRFYNEEKTKIIQNKVQNVPSTSIQNSTKKNQNIGSTKTKKLSLKTKIDENVIKIVFHNNFGTNLQTFSNRYKTASVTKQEKIKKSFLAILSNKIRKIHNLDASTYDNITQTELIQSLSTQNLNVYGKIVFEMFSPTINRNEIKPKCKAIENKNMPKAKLDTKKGTNMEMINCTLTEIKELINKIDHITLKKIFVNNFCKDVELFKKRFNSSDKDQQEKIKRRFYNMLSNTIKKNNHLKENKIQTPMKYHNEYEQVILEIFSMKNIETSQNSIKSKPVENKSLLNNQSVIADENKNKLALASQRNNITTIVRNQNNSVNMTKTHSLKDKIDQRFMKKAFTNMFGTNIPKILYDFHRNLNQREVLKEKFLANLSKTIRRNYNILDLNNVPNLTSKELFDSLKGQELNRYGRLILMMFTSNEKKRENWRNKIDGSTFKRACNQTFGSNVNEYHQIYHSKSKIEKDKLKKLFLTNISNIIQENNNLNYFDIISSITPNDVLERLSKVTVHYLVRNIILDMFTTENKTDQNNFNNDVYKANNNTKTNSNNTKQFTKENSNINQINCAKQINNYPSRTDTTAGSSGTTSCSVHSKAISGEPNTFNATINNQTVKQSTNIGNRSYNDYGQYNNDYLEQIIDYTSYNSSSRTSSYTGRSSAISEDSNNLNSYTNNQSINYSSSQSSSYSNRSSAISGNESYYNDNLWDDYRDYNYYYYRDYYNDYDYMSHNYNHYNYYKKKEYSYFTIFIKAVFYCGSVYYTKPYFPNAQGPLLYSFGTYYVLNILFSSNENVKNSKNESSFFLNFLKIFYFGSSICFISTLPVTSYFMRNIQKVLSYTSGPFYLYRILFSSNYNRKTKALEENNESSFFTHVIKILIYGHSIDFVKENFPRLQESLCYTSLSYYLCKILFSNNYTLSLSNLLKTLIFYGLVSYNYIHFTNPKEFLFFTSGAYYLYKILFSNCCYNDMRALFFGGAIYLINDCIPNPEEPLFYTSTAYYLCKTLFSCYCKKNISGSEEYFVNFVNFIKSIIYGSTVFYIRSNLPYTQEPLFYTFGSYYLFKNLFSNNHNENTYATKQTEKSFFSKFTKMLLFCGSVYFIKSYYPDAQKPLFFTFGPYYIYKMLISN